MSKSLVAYFSVSKVTKQVSETLAKVTGSDLFEIVPKALYTTEDINYMDKNSRSSVEMADLNCRPAVVNKVDNLADYDTVYLGFPIWWGREPSVVDTFLDENDLTGKNVVVFATSGGSGVEGAVNRINELLAGKTTVCGCGRLTFNASEEELNNWLEGLGK